MALPSKSVASVKALRLVVWMKQRRAKGLEQSEVASTTEETEERKMGQVMQWSVHQGKALACMCVCMGNH